MKEIDIDQDLFKRVANNDEGAFKTLFMKYFARLCAFVKTILKVDSTSQDVVQKVFVKIWEKRHQIVVEQTVLGYLINACRNESLNYLKMEKTRMKYEHNYASDYIEAYRYEMKNASGSDTFQVINKAINQLPDRCRDIYKLSKQEGLSYQEIAQYLSVSEKTVENQIGIALKKLREALKPHLALINE